MRLELGVPENRVNGMKTEILAIYSIGENKHERQRNLEGAIGPLLRPTLLGGKIGIDSKRQVCSAKQGHAEFIRDVDAHRIRANQTKRSSIRVRIRIPRFDAKGIRDGQIVELVGEPWRLGDRIAE